MPQSDHIKDTFKCYSDTINRYHTNSEWESENSLKRFNDWAGRSPTGKKLKAKMGADPFPWEGASDAAPPVVDSSIREDVDMCMTALADAQIEAHPMELSDTNTANLSSTVLKYYIKNRMNGLEAEQELAANYLFEQGKVALGITWEREICMTPTTYRIEQFMDLPVGKNALGQPVMAAHIILDPSKTDEAIQLATDYYKQESMRLVGEEFGALSPKVAKDCIEDLREKGECSLPVPYFSLNAPCISAYKYGHDIFRANESLHIQKDQRIYCREYLSEDRLRAGIAGYEWDKAWVEKVATTAKGKIATPNVNASRGTTIISVNGSNDSIDYKDSYEIVTCYYREADDDGVVTIRYMVFCPACQSDDRGEPMVGKDEPLNYEHGLFPFEDLPLEVTSRRISDSRGYGSVIGTGQRQIKVEIDSRADRASITTLPPLTYPHGRDPGPWGPGKRFSRMKADDYTFAPIPPYDRVSEIVEASAYRQINHWLGRADEHTDPIYSTLRKKRLSRKWLGLWKRAFTQAFKLIQQFSEPELVVRITNDPEARPQKVSREDIQGDFDMDITFNALSMDLEIRKQNLQYMGDILNWDSEGTIDRVNAVNVGLQIVDPEIAKSVVRPRQSASQNEIEDTKRIYANIYAGIREDIKPGQNYKLRMDVMNQIMFATDPETGEDMNPQAKQRLQSDEQFRGNVEHYMKQLKHQMVQQQNAIIGQRGA